MTVRLQGLPRDKPSRPSYGSLTSCATLAARVSWTSSYTVGTYIWSRLAETGTDSAVQARTSSIRKFLHWLGQDLPLFSSCCIYGTQSWCASYSQRHFRTGSCKYYILLFCHPRLEVYC